MLRVGLTGDLGSGKSTVARLLAARGAIILSSDETGRAMMQPGEPVFQAIVEHFGPSVLASDGALDRRELARQAFDPQHPRIEELNAIVHPAVIAEQERRMAEIARSQPDAIVVVESALIFTTKYGTPKDAGGGQPWQGRFDRILLVTAPDEVKVTRFVDRMAAGRALSEAEREALGTDARQRLAAQRIPAERTTFSLTLENSGDLAALEKRTDEVFRGLTAGRQEIEHQERR